MERKKEIEDDLREDLKEKLVAALEEINSFKKELKKKSQYGDHDLEKIRKEFDLFKLQV